MEPGEKPGDLEGHWVPHLLTRSGRYEAPLQAEPGLSSLIWGFLKVGKAAWPSLLRASPQP